MEGCELGEAVLEAELALVGSDADKEAGGLRGEITVICKGLSRKVWVGFAEMAEAKG